MHSDLNILQPKARHNEVGGAISTFIYTQEPIVIFIKKP